MERTALVTGAGRGIGLAIAQALSFEGYRLMLASRSEECVAAAASLPDAMACRADVSKPADVKKLFTEARAALGRLDVLVTSAGIAEQAPVVSTGDDVWDRIVATNLTGTFLCCREALEWMKFHKSGHIVNILSVASIEVFPNNAAYCASKFGALGFTRVLREEARTSGVRVTAVLPGAVDTKIWDHYWPGAPREKMLAADDVAVAVVAALQAREQAVVEEIVLRPRSGRL